MWDLGVRRGRNACDLGQKRTGERNCSKRRSGSTSNVIGTVRHQAIGLSSSSTLGFQSGSHTRRYETGHRDSSVTVAPSFCRTDETCECLRILEASPGFERGWRFCRFNGVMNRVVSCWSLVCPAPPFCLLLGLYWTTFGLRCRCLRHAAIASLSHSA